MKFHVLSPTKKQNKTKVVKDVKLKVSHLIYDSSKGSVNVKTDTHAYWWSPVILEIYKRNEYLDLKKKKLY